MSLPRTPPPEPKPEPDPYEDSLGVRSCLCSRASNPLITLRTGGRASSVLGVRVTAGASPPSLPVEVAAAATTTLPLLLLVLRCGRRWESSWPPLPAAAIAAADGDCDDKKGRGLVDFTGVTASLCELWVLLVLLLLLLSPAGSCPIAASASAAAPFALGAALMLPPPPPPPPMLVLLGSQLGGAAPPQLGGAPPLLTLYFLVRGLTAPG